MDVPRPSALSLDPTTHALLQDVADTAYQVNELRPLRQEVVEEILRDMLGERIYSSNAIEGNTLSLGETEAILRTHQVDPRRQREATEVLNLQRAINYVRESMLLNATPFKVAELLQVHQRLMTGLQDDIAGRLRSEPVMIRGAKHQPPDAARVDALLERVFSIGATDAGHPLVLAAWTHWALARIHPFVDGNGRIARLWQDWILLRGKLTCATILPEIRHEYLTSLAQADEGDFNPLVQLTARRVAASFDRYLAVIGKDRELQDWAASLIGNVDEGALQQRRLDYLRWQRVMERLRFEFQRCAASVNQHAKALSVDFHPAETLDFEAWNQGMDGLIGSSPLCFRLVFHRPEKHCEYRFVFGKHATTTLDSADERASRRPGVFIIETIDRDVPQRLDAASPDHPVSLRELFSVNNSLVRKRIELPSHEVRYDRDIDPTTVAREFFEEVVRAYLTP